MAGAKVEVIQSDILDSGSNSQVEVAKLLFTRWRAGGRIGMEI